MKTFDPKGALAAPVHPHSVPEDRRTPPRRPRIWGWILGFGRRRNAPERLPEVLPASHDPPPREHIVTPSAALAAGGPAIWLRYPN